MVSFFDIWEVYVYVQLFIRNVIWEILNDIWCHIELYGEIIPVYGILLFILLYISN